MVDGYFAKHRVFNREEEMRRKKEQVEAKRGQKRTLDQTAAQPGPFSLSSMPPSPWPSCSSITDYTSAAVAAVASSTTESAPTTTTADADDILKAFF